MDVGQFWKKLSKWSQKYRYPLVIVLIGLVFLAFPARKNMQSAAETPTTEAKKPDLSQQLAQILSQIDGVGKVNVMLTVAEGEKIYYQKDEDITNGDTSSSIRQETILVNDGNRNQQALISQIMAPKYQGAIIVCQGGDIPAVRWAIVEAVSKTTGLGADQISVLKMK